jgi:hypothetical protein
VEYLELEAEKLNDTEYTLVRRFAYFWRNVVIIQRTEPQSVGGGNAS